MKAPAIPILVIFKFALIAAVTVHAPCITPLNTTGKCVDLQDCPFLFEVLQLPQISSSDRHYLRASQCGNNQAQVYICCTDEYINYKPLPTPSPTPSSAPSTTQSTIPSNGNENLFPKPPRCGTFLVDRIVSNTANLQDHPWTVLLVYADADGKKEFPCIGTLITHQHVVTPAHCLTTVPNDWKLQSVRLGEFDLKTNPDCVSFSEYMDCADAYVEIEIYDTIFHPAYDRKAPKSANDIALLQLKENVNFTDFIKPICLLDNDETAESDFSGKRLELIGWGPTEKINITEKIKGRTPIEVLPLERCRTAFADNSIGFEIVDTHMCGSKSPDEGSCFLYPGSPLVKSMQARNGFGYYLLGMESFGLWDCGADDFPDVYTRMPLFTNWIKETIKDSFGLS